MKKKQAEELKQLSLIAEGDGFFLTTGVRLGVLREAAVSASTILNFPVISRDVQEFRKKILSDLVANRIIAK